MGAAEHASGVMAMHETWRATKSTQDLWIELRCVCAYEELSHINAGENSLCFLFLLRRRESKFVQGKRKVSIAGYSWNWGPKVSGHNATEIWT